MCSYDNLRNAIVCSHVDGALVSQGGGLCQAPDSAGTSSESVLARHVSTPIAMHHGLAPDWVGHLAAQTDLGFVLTWAHAHTCKG